MSTVTTSIVTCEVCGQKNRVPAAAHGVPRCGNCGSSLPWIVDAGDDSFAEVAEAARIPVLVDFWATWCGPCRTVSPALEQLARTMAGRLKLVKVDIDRSPGLAARFSVQAVPTLLLLDGGKEIAKQIGAAPEHALRSWLDGALSGSTR
jgi:thioredoxin 2